MRRLLGVLIVCSGASALIAQEPATGSSSGLDQLRDELATLRGEMARRDARIEELEARLHSLTMPDARGGAGGELETALVSLREELRHSTGPMLDEDEPAYPKFRFGGQLRWRAESRLNFDFDDDLENDQDFVEQRTRVNVGVDVKENVKAFIQVQDARRWGEEMSVLDDSADGLDIHQAYLDLEKILDEKDRLRIGRQEINLGHQRLISALDWATQARTFDGLLYSWQMGESQWNAWYITLRESMPTTEYQDSQVAGVYGTFHPFPEENKSDLDVYAIFLNDDLSGARQERWTLGSRIEGEHKSGLYYELEGALQFGDSTTGTAPEVREDIPFGDVFAYVARLGYRLQETGWKPRFIVEWNHASGDGNPGDGNNTRFNTLFPLAHAHNGYMDFTFWENTRNLALRFDAKPCEDVTVGVDTWFFWTDRAADAIRGPSFTIAGAPGISRHAGTEVDLTGKWQTSHGLNFLAGYSFFVPAGRIEDVVGQDDLAHFLYLMVGIKF